MRRGLQPWLTAPLLLTALLPLLLAGCGLPDPFFLNPPVVSPPQGSTQGEFTMQNTDRSGEPDFRGFELYYKLYADEGSISADTNLGAGVPGVDALVQKGFLALCRGPGTLQQDLAVAGRSRPVIPIAPADRAAAFQITIQFVPTTDAETNVTYTSPAYPSTFSQEMDRFVDGVNRCKPFTFGAGNYVSSDADYSAIAIASGGGPPSDLFVALYAVSYGLQNLSTPIYSSPVYMGYLRLPNFVP